MADTAGDGRLAGANEKEGQEMMVRKPKTADEMADGMPPSQRLRTRVIVRAAKREAILQIVDEIEKLTYLVETDRMTLENWIKLTRETLEREIT